MSPLQMQWLQGLQPQSPQGMPGMGSFMPQMPSMAPQMPMIPQIPGPEMHEVPQPEASPLQLGSRAAMESVEMNDAQRRRAEGLAIMAFASNMSKSKAHNQLGAINESFAPAAQAYQEEQARATKVNEKALQRQLAFEKEARMTKQFEDRMLQQERLADKRLAQQSAMHDAMTPYQEKKLALDEKKLEAKSNKDEFALEKTDNPFVNALPPIKTKAQYTDLSNVRKKHDSNVNDIVYIRNSVKTLRDLYKDEAIKPDNPILNEVAPSLVKMKNLSSYLKDPGNKARLAEKIRLYAQGKLKRLNVTLEGADRSSRGAAVPLQMIKMFEEGNVYPQLTHGMDSAMYGLGELLKEQSDKRDTAGASLKYGKVFTETELKQWKKIKKQEKEAAEEAALTQRNQQLLGGFGDEVLE